MVTKTKTVKSAVKTALAPVVTKTEVTAINKALGIQTQGEDVAAGRKPVGTVSAKEATLAIFQAAPDKEFKTDEVVMAVEHKLPKVKKETILWMITLAKKEGLIHRVRNDGHQHVLKLGANPTKVISKPSTAKAAGTGDLASVLKELTRLVEQRAGIDAEIERLKKLI
jgi:Fe2+ or Zn2+ uptake regulation protein